MSRQTPSKLRAVLQDPPLRPPSKPLAGDRAARQALIVIALLLAYGCLYPFNFTAIPRRLLSLPRVASIGDMVANLLLYLPIGICGFFGLTGLRRIVFRGIAAVTLGGALSLGIEIAQAYDIGRHSSVLDVILNTLGTLLGFVAAFVVARAAFWTHRDDGAGIGAAMLLLVLWAACRLVPFVAAFDWQQVARALAPLGGDWRPLWPVVFELAILWLVCMRLIEAIGSVRPVLPATLSFVLMLSALRTLIPGHIVSPQEIYGVAAAAGCFMLGLNRAWLVALALVIYLIADGLMPYASGPTRAMNWVPLRGFIRSNIEFSMKALMFKSFTYGALAWLLGRMGLRGRYALGVGAAIVFAIEWGQQFVPGRFPDITDVLIYVSMAFVLRQFDRIDLRPDRAGVGGAIAVQSTARPGGT